MSSRQSEATRDLPAGYPLLWSVIAPALGLEIGPVDLEFPALPQLTSFKQALALSGNSKSISGP